MSTAPRKKILVVDDMEINRKVLAAILSDTYSVIEAENGLRAKEVLRRQGKEISLVLLDIVMPIMDGFALMRYMRERAQYQDIPVILVSSETYEDTVKEAIDLGVCDVIAKPYSPALLVHRVNNMVRMAERSAAAAKHEQPKTPAEEPKKVRNSILIVDDSGINREILKLALEDNYTILEAVNGEEGVAMLEQQKDEIALMLLDIIMPVMDGFAVMRTAQRRKLLRDIPVIVISVEDSLPKINRIIEMGASEVIQKPFTPAVVRNRIDNMLKCQMGEPAAP